MKILTVLGTRPEIIRLSRIIEKLDSTCKQVLVHTGQNYDANLNDVFFQQLGVRAPDYYLNAKGGLGQQVGTILAETEKVLLARKTRQTAGTWGYKQCIVCDHRQAIWHSCLSYGGW